MASASADQILQSLRSDAPHRHFRGRELLVRKRETPQAIWLIEDGWAARFKLLRDGRRHISRVYAPGDLCDLAWLVTDSADQSIIALTPVRAARLDLHRLDSRMRIDPAVSLTVARDALAEMRAQAGSSRSDANRRVRRSHIFCASFISVSNGGARRAITIAISRCLNRMWRTLRG